MTEPNRLLQLASRNQRLFAGRDVSGQLPGMGCDLHRRLFWLSASSARDRLRSNWEEHFQSVEKLDPRERVDHEKITSFDLTVIEIDIDIAGQ